jgi:hypothetical protein
MSGVIKMPKWFDINNYDPTGLTNEKISQQVFIRKALNERLFKIDSDSVNRTLNSFPKEKSTKDQNQWIESKLGAYYKSWQQIISGEPFSFCHIDELNWNSEHVSFKGASYCQSLNESVSSQHIKYLKSPQQSKKEYSKFSIERKSFTPFEGAMIPHLFHLELESKSDNELLAALKFLLPNIRKKLSIPNDLKKQYSPNKVEKIRVADKTLATIDLMFWQTFNDGINRNVLEKALGVHKTAKRVWPGLEKAAINTLKSNDYFVE